MSSFQTKAVRRRERQLTDVFVVSGWQSEGRTRAMSSTRPRSTARPSSSTRKLLVSICDRSSRPLCSLVFSCACSSLSCSVSPSSSLPPLSQALRAFPLSSPYLLPLHLLAPLSCPLLSYPFPSFPSLFFLFFRQVSLYHSARGINAFYRLFLADSFSLPFINKLLDFLFYILVSFY